MRTRYKGAIIWHSFSICVFVTSYLLLQLRIHTNDTPDQIPVSIQAYPIRYYDSCTPIALLGSAVPFHHMLLTQMLHDRWVDGCRHFLWPRSHLPEIARRQEIYKQWEFLSCLVLLASKLTTP